MIEGRSGEFKHPIRNQAEVSKRFLVRVLAYEVEDVPRNGTKQGGGLKVDLRKVGGEKEEGRAHQRLSLGFMNDLAL